MITFPSLEPDNISYSLGAMNVSEEPTVNSGPIRFRHSLKVSGHSLQLQFASRRESDVELIRQHYSDNDGSHRYFDLPVIVWGGAVVVAGDSVYRYESPPEEEHLGVFFNVTVALRVIAGVFTLYILQGGGASQPAVTAFTSFVFNGNQPFILNGQGVSPVPTLILQGGGASQ